MAQIAQAAQVGALVDGLAIIAGGAYGFISKGSKISLIASGICGIILIALSHVKALFCGIWAVLMFVMFMQKFMKIKSNNSSSEMQQKLLADPAEARIQANSKTIMLVLTLLSLVEAVLCFAAPQ
mmetsp:Transcript_23446/g.67184  ORF Transcript_23446/g.67184 Transcript_23446/m.67184 type:complete len:125 (+) Transcript_23446:65-439(+)